MALAAEALRSKDKLAVQSRFKALAEDVSRDFRGDVAFIYLNQLIAQALALNLTGYGLVELIRNKLSQIDFERFEYSKIYKKDGAYYLPYQTKDRGERLLLKFFTPKTGESAEGAVKIEIADSKSVFMEVLAEGGSKRVVSPGRRADEGPIGLNRPVVAGSVISIPSPINSVNDVNDLRDCGELVLAINPGSTNTKIGLYGAIKGEPRLYEIELTITGATKDVAKDAGLVETAILDFLRKSGVALERIAAVCGRGGFLKPNRGGLIRVNRRNGSGEWEIDPEVYKDLVEEPELEHESNMGAVVAAHIAAKCGSKGVEAFVLDPVTTYSLEPVARLSGKRGFERRAIWHALNSKAVFAEFAQFIGQEPSRTSAVVAHLGGGVSVSVFKDGKAVDVTNALVGEGPFTIKRGMPQAADMIAHALARNAEGRNAKEIILGEFARVSGLISYAGNDGLRKIVALVEEGRKTLPDNSIEIPESVMDRLVNWPGFEEELVKAAEKLIKKAEEKGISGETLKTLIRAKVAEAVLEAMAYQITKHIGAFSMAQGIRIDGVVITGGCANCSLLVDMIARRIRGSSGIPVYVLPGSLEQWAMAQEAFKALKGDVAAEDYMPVHQYPTRILPDDPFKGLDTRVAEPARAFPVTQMRQLVRFAKECGPKRIALAEPNRSSLAAVYAAFRIGIINYAYFVGNRAEINNLLAQTGRGMGALRYEIIDTGRSKEPLNNSDDYAKEAVRIVKSGGADLVMKGAMPTGTILKAVLDKKEGLSGKDRASYITVVPSMRGGGVDFITDAGINTDTSNPQVMAALVRNAAYLARVLGVEPKVALLSALEKVNPRIPGSLLAKRLASLGWNIPVSGPLSWDVATDIEAAEEKGASSDPVAGKANVLVCPDINTANVVYKLHEALHKKRRAIRGLEVDMASAVVGIERPLVLISRSDSARTKLLTIALNILLLEAERAPLSIGKAGDAPQGDAAELSRKIASVFAEALDIARNETTEYFEEHLVLSEISKTLASMGRTEEALAIAKNKITDRYCRSLAFSEISKALSSMGRTEEASQLIEKALYIARNEIAGPYRKSLALLEISKALSIMGRTEEALQLIEESNAIASGLHYFRRCHVLLEISKTLSIMGRTEEALAIAKEKIDIPYHKYQAFLEISKTLSSMGRTEEASQLIEKALDIARYQIKDPYDHYRILLDMSNDRIMSYGAEEALDIPRNDTNAYFDEHLALSIISKTLSSMGRTEEALAIAREINNPYNTYITSLTLLEASKALSSRGRAEEASQLVEEVLAIARKIYDPHDKSLVLLEASKALSGMGRTEEALAIARNETTRPFDKSLALLEASKAVGLDKVAQEDMDRCIMWFDLSFPYEQAIFSEYLGSANARRYIDELKIKGQNAISGAFDYNDPAALFLAFIGTRLSGVNIGYEEFKQKIASLAKFEAAHQGYFLRLFAKEKDYPVIDLSGKALTYDVSDVDTRVLDSHIEEVLSTKQKVDSLQIEAPDVFVKRIYAYVKTKEALERDPLLKGRIGQLNTDKLDAYLRRHQKDIPSAMGPIRRNLNGAKYLCEAVFFVSYQAYKNTQDPGRPSYVRLMRDAIITDNLSHTELLAQMQSRDVKQRIDAFKIFYEDYRHHLPNSLGIRANSIKGLSGCFSEFTADLYAQLSKVTVVKSKTEESFRLVPVGFLSVFRGMADIIDCSINEDGGTPYTRAMHEDTRYYFIYKGKELKGYIGMCEAIAEDGNKVLTIDVIQSPSIDGEGLLRKLFSQLNEIAINKGFAGVALPEKEALEASFNFDNEKTCLSLREYNEGMKIKVKPIHEESWRYFTKMFDKDESNSIEKGEFVLLALPKGVVDQRKQENRRRRQAPKGTPATLLLFMAEKGYSSPDKAARISELAKKRGGNDSRTTIYDEIIYCRKAGLILGDAKSGYYLPRWRDSADKVARFIAENPCLNKASPSAEEVEELRKKAGSIREIGPAGAITQEDTPRVQTGAASAGMSPYSMAPKPSDMDNEIRLFMSAIDAGSLDRMPPPGSAEEDLMRFDMGRLKKIFKNSSLDWDSVERLADMANESWESLGSTRRLVFNKAEETLYAVFLDDMNRRFYDFASACRRRLDEVRKEAERKDFNGILISALLSIMWRDLDHEFSPDALDGIRHSIKDALAGCYEIAFLVKKKVSRSREKIRKMIEEAQTSLTELEKLAKAGRLLEIDRAYVRSGVYDASRVLGSGKTGVKAQGKPETPKKGAPRGTPATLLLFMVENGYFGPNKAAKISELAKKRGGNDSRTTIYEEIKYCRRAGLVRGDPKGGFYLPGWLDSVDKVARFIAENPCLNKASPSDTEIDELRKIAESALKLEKSERIAIALRSFDHGPATDIFNAWTLVFMTLGLVERDMKEDADFQRLNAIVNPIYGAIGQLRDMVHEAIRGERYNAPLEGKTEGWLLALAKIEDTLAAACNDFAVFQREAGWARLKEKMNDPSDVIRIEMKLAHIGEIVGNRLRYARGVPEKTVHDLEELVRRGCQIHPLEDEKPLSGITVINHEGGSLPVAADRISFLNAIANIIYNAKYWIDEKDGIIEVEISREGDFASVKIRDNGPGITRDLLEAGPNGRQKVFDLDVTKRKGGTGLGTTETWYAIKDMGGTISAESRHISEYPDNHGTTFTLRLPLADTTQLSADDPAGLSGARHAPGHVATFFGLLYGPEFRGKAVPFEVLRSRVPIRETDSLISSEGSRRDLSKLVRAGLVRSEGTGEMLTYASTIDDERLIQVLYEELSMLSAVASAEEVQAVARNVIGSNGFEKASADTSERLFFARDMSRQEIYAKLRKMADKDPSLKSAVTGDGVRLGVRLSFRRFVYDRIAPASIIKNRTFNPDCVVVVDDLDPSNYLVIRTERPEAGKVKVTVLGDNAETFIVDERERYALNNLKNGIEFYGRMAIRDAKVAPADRAYKSGPESGRSYSNVSFTRGAPGHIGITVNLAQATGENGERYWLMPGESYEDDDAGKEVSCCLIDSHSKVFARHETLPTLDEIKNSGGKFAAYPAEYFQQQEWLRIKQEDSFRYFRNIGTREEPGKPFAVYRRVDIEDMVTAIRISPDRKTFAIEGLTLDNEPLLIDAGHIHIGAFLYVLLNDDPRELGPISPDIRERIRVSPSLRKLIATHEQIIDMKNARIPTGWRQDIVGGKVRLIAADYQTIWWPSRWGPNVREQLAKEKLGEARYSLIDRIPRAAAVKKVAVPIMASESRWGGIFADTLKLRSFEAKKRGENIIIALETNTWIPSLQRRELQPLLTELGRLEEYLKKLGLDNVRIVRGTGDELAGNIADEQERSGVLPKNIVVLSSQQTLESAAFDPFRSREGDDRALLAGIDAKNIGESDYVRLLEMLTIAARMAFGDSLAVVSGDHPAIHIEEIGRRIIRLIPKAAAFRYEERKAIYDGQAKALAAA